MSRDRLRLALDVYAAVAEREEAAALARVADPTDDLAWQDAVTREMNARAAETDALRAHFAATHLRTEVAQQMAVAICQLAFA